MQRDLSVREVLTTIQHGALQWPKERLRVSNSSILEMHDIQGVPGGMDKTLGECSLC